MAALYDCHHSAQTFPIKEVSKVPGEGTTVSAGLSPGINLITPTINWRGPDTNTFPPPRPVSPDWVHTKPKWGCMVYFLDTTAFVIDIHLIDHPGPIQYISRYVHQSCVCLSLCNRRNPASRWTGDFWSQRVLPANSVIL